MWDTVVATWSTFKDLYHSFILLLYPVMDFIVATGVPEQIEKVKYHELFTNSWFLVPYMGWIVWCLFRRQLNTVIIILLCTGSWAFFGTPYMQGILNQDEIQLETVLPVVGGACLVMAIIIYLIFFKSE